MAEREISVDELKQFSILNSLNPAELQALKGILGQVTLNTGEILFKEGEASNEIYLILEGCVEICKTGSQETFVIAENKTGEVFGELAFLDGSPRSAQVRAANACCLLVIEKEPLYTLPFCHRIVEKIAKISSEKLRESASDLVGSLEKQIETVKTQNDFGQFFIYILSLMAIGMIVNNLLHTYLTDISPYSLGFFVFYSLILLLPSLLIVWKLKMPMASMGMTMENWKQSLIEGAGLSILIIVLFTGASAIVRHLGIWNLKPFSFAALSPWYMPPIYLLHTAAQELFSRGFLQTAFERFFNDKTGVRSIGFAALLFALFHIHFGIGAVAITFISSLVFGSLYRRHKNLVGVSILHYVAGVWAFVCGAM